MQENRYNCLNNVSDITAGDSFDTKSQWDNCGDIGCLEHNNTAESNASIIHNLNRPGSSTPNKSKPKPDTPRPDGSHVNLDDSVRSSESFLVTKTNKDRESVRSLYIISLDTKLSDEEDTINNKSFKTPKCVSEFSVQTTPDSIIKGIKRPASDLDPDKVSDDVDVLINSITPVNRTTRVGKNKKQKTEDPIPLIGICRLWIDLQNPTDYELIFIQKSLPKIIKSNINKVDPIPLYYTQLQNGQAYVKGPEKTLVSLGKSIRIKPNPNETRVLDMELGAIFNEPRDDGSIDHNLPPYPTYSETSMERELVQSSENSLAVHQSINMLSAKQNNPISTSFHKSTEPI